MEEKMGKNRSFLNALILFYAFFSSKVFLKRGVATKRLSLTCVGGFLNDLVPLVHQRVRSSIL